MSNPADDLRDEIEHATDCGGTACLPLDTARALLLLVEDGEWYLNVIRNAAGCGRMDTVNYCAGHSRCVLADRMKREADRAYQYLHISAPTTPELAPVFESYMTGMKPWSAGVESEAWSAEPLECYVYGECSAGQLLLDADAAVREARCREEEMRVRLAAERKDRREECANRCTAAEDARRYSIDHIDAMAEVHDARCHEEQMRVEFAKRGAEHIGCDYPECATCGERDHCEDCCHAKVVR